MHLRRSFAIAIVSLAAGSAVAAPILAGEPVDYARDVKTILARHCYACHGVLRQQATLRLDVASAIARGGESGAAILPGNAAASLLVQRVTAADPAERMPPEGEPLSRQQIQILKDWIDQGAPAPDEPLPADPRDHWSFKPPVRPPLPADSIPEAGAIDAFLAAAQRAQGIVPADEAPRNVLLRRVYLDLIGVPPTRDELQAFLRDESPAAYETVVDSLLADPRHGERWARHWMDVWRYSDWSGFGAEVRYSQRHIWHWRDWIVESLNADKPYDQMVVEMLAADEIAPADPANLRATGYLARNWYLFNRNYWLDSTVEHAGKAFLGVTVNCARCHDHMYDPIAQEDYFRLRAFFEPHDVRTDRVPGQADLSLDGLPRVYDKAADAPTYVFARGNEAEPLADRPIAPGVPEIFGTQPAIQPVELAPSAHVPALADFWRREVLAQARTSVDQGRANLTVARQTLATADDAARATAQAAVTLGERTMAAAEANLVSQTARIAADLARFARPPAPEAGDLALAAGLAHREWQLRQAEENAFRVEGEVAAAQRALEPANEATKTALAAAEAKLTLAREALGKEQAAATNPPADYPPLGPVYPGTSTGRRLALARWMVHRDNPLAARVAVNHIWLRHFDAPLVPTVFDFGRNGKPPVHPELLDWLAVDLMEGGWNMKRLHKAIVTSQAYRRLSAATEKTEVSLAADPENRTLWRMNARRMEAESVRDSVLHLSGQLDPLMGGPALDQNLGLSSNRRSLYFHHAYEKKMLFLTLFDGASENACYRRGTSVIPQQALALANSQLSLDKSRLLAKSLGDKSLGELAAGELAPGASDRDEAFVKLAFEHVLCRSASPAELETCRQFLRDQAALFVAGGLAPATGGGAAAVKPATDPAERARENLVHVLFNHHDFVTVR
jgi:hypothetical protein